MSEELNQLPEKLADIERTLGTLRPTRGGPGGGLDRDRVLFEAGRAAAVRAGRGHVRLWQGACGAELVIACAGMAVGLVRDAGNETGPDVVRKPVTPPTLIPGSSDPQTVAAIPPASQAGADDDWAAISLPGIRAGTLSDLLSGTSIARGGVGGGAEVAALKKGDGLDALPVWQRRALTKGNGL